MEKIDIEEEKKNQKHLLTSLDIICPPIPEQIARRRIICEYGAGLTQAFWARFPYEEGKAYSEVIRENFQFEMGTLTPISEPAYSYFLCFNLLLPGVQRSKKWVVAACISVSQEEILDWLWMHPFLRGHGFMRDFLVGYACNEGPLIIQPPVSEAMQRCTNKVTEKINSDPELKRKHIHIQKKYVSNKYQVPFNVLEDLEDKRFSGIMSGLTLISAQKYTKGWDWLTDDKIHKIVNYQIYCAHRCQKDPEFEKNFIKEFEPYLNPENIEAEKKAVQEFIRTGGDYR